MDTEKLSCCFLQSGCKDFNQILVIGGDQLLEQSAQLLSSIN
jgi:hypothetical protein